jgi:hypothetical protein
MFYCEPCGTERAWPVDGLTMAMTGSYGPCECCGTKAPCFDVASQHLPAPRTQPPGTSEVTDGR